MYEVLKRFSKHSAIYFAGSVLNRLALFLLLPLYTNYFSPEEYGKLELIFVTVAFIRVFLGMLLGHSVLRFFFEYESEADKKSLVGTSLFFSLTWCAGLTLVIMYFSENLTLLVFGADNSKSLFILGFSVMFFEVTSEIPLAFLRAKEHSMYYVLTSFLQLVLRITLNIYMVVFLGLGIPGVLTGNLLSAAIVWALLVGITLRYSGLVFDFSKLKKIFRYIYPLEIESVPGIVLVNADRFSLNFYSTLKVVGIYALALRFGMILQTLISEPFQANFGPFRFLIMNRDDAKEIYARILTYYLYFVMILGLIITLYSMEVIEVMSSHQFRDAYKVVPIISLALILRGLGYIVQTGILLQKRTGYMPYIQGASSVFYILLLIFLVPKLTVYGAAFAVLGTQCLQLIMTNYFSQKLYPIAFEYQRIAKILAVAVFIYVISVFTNGMDLSIRIGIKTVLIGLFPILLITLKFHTKGEVEKFLMLKNAISLRVTSIFNHNS